MSLRPLGAAVLTGIGVLVGSLVAGPGAESAGARDPGAGPNRYAAADAQINPWGLSAQRRGASAAVAELRFGALPLAAQGPGGAPAPGGNRRAVSGWIPFWNYEPGLRSFRANADLFTDVYGFFHEADSRGQIRTYAGASQIRRLRSAAREAGVPQFAFADGRATWKRTRGHWVTFMRELGAALHRRGKLLSTATPAIYDGSRRSGSGYWVYDWEGIAPHVDRVGVMTYDYSYERRGPTSPRGWFRRTAEYAAEVLGDKAGMGVPAFGYDWSRCSGRNSMTQSQALRKARSRGKQPDRDNWAGEGRFEYRQGRCRHVVWFGDPATIGERAATAVESGTGSIAIWALGNESPRTWREIRRNVG